MTERLDAALEWVARIVKTASGSATLRVVAKRGRQILGPVALVALFSAVWSARSSLVPIADQVSPLRIVLAILLWSLIHLVPASFDWLILREIANGIELRDLYRVYLARLPAKYLPGGVWHNVSRLADLHERGVSGRSLAILGALQISVPAGTALLLGGWLVLMSPISFPPAAPIAVFALGTLLLTPKLLTVFRTGQARLTAITFTKAAVVASVTWLFASLAFSTYYGSFSIASDEGFFTGTSGAYLIGWATGFLSIITPQGLGVFEASAAALLPTDASFDVVVAVVAGFRLVSLTSDLMVWAAYTFICRALVAFGIR